MTQKQIEQFNRMRDTLIKISKGYRTPNQLLSHCEEDYGLDYEEALGMTYENIQLDAKNAVKGVKILKSS